MHLTQARAVESWQLVSPRVLALVAAVLVAVAAGLIAAFVGPTRVAVLAGLVAVAFIGVYSMPRTGGFALVVTFAVVTGLYTELSDPLYAPPLSFGGISLHYLDLLLLAVGAMALLAWRSFGGLRLVELVLAAFVVWTVAIGIVRSLYLGLTFDIWTRELRTIAYFAFPILLLPLLNSPRRLQLAGRLLLWTSVGVALMALFVRVFHDSIPFQSNLLIYRDSYGVRVFQVFGVERATWAFVFGVALLLTTGRRWLWALLAANAATLVVALTRGSYVAVGVAVMAIVIGLGRLRPGRVLFAVVIAGFLMLGAAVGLSWLSGEDVLTPFTGRLATLEELTTGEGTVGVRATEARVVLSFFEEEPGALLVGQGLGGYYSDPYNELTAEIDSLGDRRYSYVHNGYLWYLLRGGVASAVLLYGFCALLIVGCLRRARQVREPWFKGTLVGVAGVFIAALTLSFSGAPLSEGLRMSVLMLFAAIGLAGLRLAENELPKAAVSTT